MIPWGRIYFGGFYLRMVNHDETGVAYERWLPQPADADLFLGEKKAEEPIYYLIDDRWRTEVPSSPFFYYSCSCD